MFCPLQSQTQAGITPIPPPNRHPYVHNHLGIVPRFFLDFAKMTSAKKNGCFLVPSSEPCQLTATN